MIKEAIENTGVTGNPKKLTEERIKIRDYCRYVKGFEGIQTIWDFEDGKPAGIAAYLFKIQDGKKVFVASTK
jgi:branched-chain amino acid transport system substrate-binding protein